MMTFILRALQKPINSTMLVVCSAKMEVNWAPPGPWGELLLRIQPSDPGHNTKRITPAPRLAMWSRSRWIIALFAAVQLALLSTWESQYWLGPPHPPGQ